MSTYPEYPAHGSLSMLSTLSTLSTLSPKYCEHHEHSSGSRVLPPPLTQRASSGKAIEHGVQFQQLMLANEAALQRESDEALRQRIYQARLSTVRT